MKVVATQTGYIGHKRRYAGDTFHIDEKLYSEKWMKKIDAGDEEKSGKVENGKVNFKMSVNQLHEYCKKNGLTGYSGLSKAELIEAINNDELEVETVESEETIVDEDEVI